MEAWIGGVGRTGRRGPAMAWAGLGWRGLGRRRRGLGDERDESLRDERDDESLRVMMRVHGEIE